jgi:hypothetical protein
MIESIREKSMEDGSLPYGVVPTEIRDEARRDTIDALEARRTQYDADRRAETLAQLGILATPHGVVTMLDQDLE